jgi:hypothetical protein
MKIQTTISDDDYEILTDFCNTERISVSALLNVLATDFLECTDKAKVTETVSKALKIKSGRPKQGW